MAHFTAARDAHRRCDYDELMRAVVVYLTLLLLLALSAAAGYLASDWPRVCAGRQWCAAGWPRHH